jgi:cyanophycin synthetase
MAIDAEMQSCLVKQGLDLQSVAAAGQEVKLRRMANIAQGGTSVDFTDTIHPDNIFIAERAAKIIGLAVGGIDFITPDITRSWKEVGGGFCEVNATPGLRVHWTGNKNRDVVTPIVDMLFPDGDDGRIPTAMIIGSGDRAAVCRILNRILSVEGHMVGAATSSNARSGDDILIDGDGTGILGAHTVLSDPLVTAAILEIPIDHRLDRGIYLEYADVVTFADISGEEDIAARIAVLERMLHASRKAIVLEVDDKLSRHLIPRIESTKLILCATDPDDPVITEHLMAGGRALVSRPDGEGENLSLLQNDGEELIARIPDVTLDPGLLLAVATAVGMSVPAATIATAVAARAE